MARFDKMTVSNKRLECVLAKDEEWCFTRLELFAMAEELLALRKAFSEPVAYTAQENIDGFGGSAGYMWPPGNQKPTDVALYCKPTLP
jgi:hypothetical protein